MSNYVYVTCDEFQGWTSHGFGILWPTSVTPPEEVQREADHLVGEGKRADFAFYDRRYDRAVFSVHNV